jgi:hypothetical protein
MPGFVLTGQVFLVFTYNDEGRLEMFMSRAGQGGAVFGREVLRLL